MKKSEIQVRRKPRQSRAKLTQEALQESFVRLLHERPADKITIREITEVAGVGLGTFYEYFSKKEDLIALTIHLHVKHHADLIKCFACELDHAYNTGLMTDYLKEVIGFQISQIQKQQYLWSQIFLLERQISNIESYRKSYAMMVSMWQQVLTVYVEQKKLNIKAFDSHRIALNLQRVCYGFVSQTLLIDPEFSAWHALEQDIYNTLENLLITD